MPVALDMSGLLIKTFSLYHSWTGERTLEEENGMVDSETTHIKEHNADRIRSSWMMEVFFVAYTTHNRTLRGIVMQLAISLWRIYGEQTGT
jgi:hypothetical protein